MIQIAVNRERFPAWYRVIVPAYAKIPYSGMGAARRGGRFNRPGQEALYLSCDEPLFPSQAQAGSVNLVIYDSSRRSRSELEIYDPDSRLSNTQ